MSKYSDMTREELRIIKRKLEKQYEEYQEKNLKLDMSRGKPASAQLDLCNDMLNFPKSYCLENGMDVRNYGILTGIEECRRLFGDLLGLSPERIIIGGNASLQLMYDAMARLCLYGTQGETPWNTLKVQGEKVKFLCPSPGYDRHFAICESLGIDMITIPLLEDGPDMDMVEAMVAEDPMIKGMWCVPLYSNPQGVCYSEETIERLVSMQTAAADFRIFWDNAYGVHHIYEEVKQKNIFELAREHGTENRIYYFFSTSKITFPGAGISLISSGKENIEEMKKVMSAQTIGYDKINQLRHVEYFKSPDAIRKHMQSLANELRPKFQVVLDTLEVELGGLGLAEWSHPKGGYFVSVNTLPGCAKHVVNLAKEAGVKLTEAGATYPYGQDPKDSNIRIAPSYPVREELQEAMKLFCLCVKLAGVSKILDDA